MPICLYPEAAAERAPRSTGALSNGTYILGRSRRADVFVSDPNASRRHARLVVNASGAYIDDLESKNGTLVNGRPLQHRQRIEAGDCITIGDQRFFVGDCPAELSTATSYPWDDTEAAHTFDQTERTLDLLDVLLSERHHSESDAETLVPLVVSAVDELLDTAGTTRPELTQNQALRIGRLIGSLAPRAKSSPVRAWQMDARRRLNALVRQNMAARFTAI